MRGFIDKPGFLLARVDQICTSLHGELSPAETLAQVELMLLLDGLGAGSQARLARAASIDTSTIAYVVANLAARGLVERCGDSEDRRRAMVALSVEGAARIGRARSDYARLQAQLMAPLEAAAAARLTALLARLGSRSGDGARNRTMVKGPLDDAPSLLCRRALQRFHAQFVTGLRDYRLTPRQYSLLFILSRVPRLTQTRFARLFGLDPSTCAVIMRNLAARGLIAGAPSPDDRRARDYCLTEAGREALRGAAPLVDQSERLAFDGMKAADRDWLVRQLQRIVGHHSHRLRFPGALPFARPR